MSGPIGRRRKRIESTRNNPDLLVAFCLIGAVAGLMSLAIARDLGEVVALVLFVLGVSTIPLGLRGGLRLEHAKVAALILVLGLLVYMAQSATVQEFNQLYWFGVLPLAGGLLMGRRGIVLGGGLAFFATTLITLSYSTDAEEGSFSSPFFIDANVFVLSVVFMTFVYERMYGRALLRAERNLAAEARSRQRLARSEAELRAILDHEPQCVKQVSRKGALLDMNPAGLRLIGYDSVEEVRGMDVRDLVVPEHRERFEEDLDAVFRGEKRVRRFEITTRDGTRRWMEQHAAPLLDDEKNVVSLLAVSHEVTEQMRTENERLRSQRMEAIGSVAGGIAHDLNNVLTPMRLGLDELRETPQAPTDVVEVLESGIEHASSMLRQILLFARGVDLSLTTVDVGELVGSVGRLLSSTLPEHMQLDTHVEDALPTTLADPTQLQQILLNLCLNARDAMSQNGKITVTAHRLDVAHPVGPGSEHAGPGPYLALSVTDTGTGIPEEHVGKVFDPFFTTKKALKGTGLGLSTVLGIVTGHRGFLTLRSVPGEGTRVTAHIPIRSRSETREDLERPQADRPLGRGRHVLLVDDDPTIVTFAAKTLSGWGFAVDTAFDGLSGAERFERSSGRFDLLITDLHMPGLDGLHLVDRVRACSEAPVILMSGRLDEATQSRLLDYPELLVLQKPFGRRELGETISRALERNERAAS